MVIVSGKFDASSLHGVPAGLNLNSDACQPILLRVFVFTFCLRQRTISRCSEQRVLFAALRSSHLAPATAVSRFITRAFRYLGNDGELKD